MVRRAQLAAWTFAKGHATDDTERAKLWDIQDQKIKAHGKTIVDVKFHGQANETPVPASIKVDVSDVARNVASMGRLLRAGLAFHESRAHLLDGKWRIKNDDQRRQPNVTGSSLQFGCRSAAPEGETCKSKPAVGARVAPIAADEEWKKAAEWSWLDLCETLV